MTGFGTVTPKIDVSTFRQVACKIPAVGLASKAALKCRFLGMRVEACGSHALGAFLCAFFEAADGRPLMFTAVML